MAKLKIRATIPHAPLLQKGADFSPFSSPTGHLKGEGPEGEAQILLQLQMEEQVRPAPAGERGKGPRLTEPSPPGGRGSPQCPGHTRPPSPPAAPSRHPLRLCRGAAAASRPPRSQEPPCPPRDPALRTAEAQSRGRATSGRPRFRAGTAAAASPGPGPLPSPGHFESPPPASILTARRLPPPPQLSLRCSPRSSGDSVPARTAPSVPKQPQRRPPSPLRRPFSAPLLPRNGGPEAAADKRKCRRTRLCAGAATPCGVGGERGERGPTR